MSFILQAQKRAEEDRRAAARGPGAGRGQATAPARRPRWPWLVGLGVGIVATTLVLGAVFAVRRPSGVAAVAPPSPAPRASAERVPTVQAPPPAADTRPPQPPSLDVAARARAGAGGETNDVQSPPEPAAEATAPPKADPPLAMVSPVAPSPPAPPVPAPPPAPAPGSVPSPHAGTAARRARSAPPAYTPQPDPRAPLWQSARRMAAAPEPGHEAEHEGEFEVSQLKIEVLVWAADPEKRMVYLNGRKFVEGESIENGTVVERIVEDGVVLLHNGQRIRLRSEAR